MDSPPKHSLERRWRPSMLLAAALLAAPLPALAEPVAAPSELRDEIADRAQSDLRAFYRSRENRPLWITRDGRLDPAGQALLDLVRGAQVDGVNPRKLKFRDLDSALRRAGREPTADSLGKAEITLSKIFVAYVKASRQAGRAPMTYVGRGLEPVVPTTEAILRAAAAAPSLEKYVAGLGWMHPLYGQLRQAASGPLAPDQQALIQANLARLRAIPADPAARYVLIDAAGARLWMYENGRPVGSMKVVVGKVDNQTPMMAGFLRHAILNPYWNVPTDLAQQRIASNVLEKGIGYLRAGGYQVMSGWGDDARPVDPATVDWPAVASGHRKIRVRQLPGPDNFMGKVKFEFPNDLGIYLHDTPEKELMVRDERQFSSGCVRLEDAQRLGKWLFRKPLPRRVNGIEKRVDLPELVPVYITYLTAMPQNGRIVFQADPYGRDRTTLATRGGESRSR